MNKYATAALNRLDDAYRDYEAILRGPMAADAAIRRHSISRLPSDRRRGSISRLPSDRRRYGRDEEEFEDDPRETLRQLRECIDRLTPEQRSRLLELLDGGDLGEDEPPEFSGRPRPGGEMDRIGSDPDYQARESARTQEERDFDRPAAGSDRRRARSGAMDARSLAYDARFRPGAAAVVPAVRNFDGVQPPRRPHAPSSAAMIAFAARFPNIVRVRTL
jgi:hypothetical protein